MTDALESERVRRVRAEKLVSHLANLVEVQRAKIERLERQANNDICEIERLRRALHDIAEVYAGMEGIPPGQQTYVTVWAVRCVHECAAIAADALGRTSRPQPELLTEDPDHGDDA